MLHAYLLLGNFKIISYTNYCPYVLLYYSRFVNIRLDLCPESPQIDSRITTIFIFKIYANIINILAL